MNFKKKRLEKNMTQTELAECLKVTQAAVAMWENGAAKPRADNLVAMAKIFGCTIDELIRE